MRHFSESDVVTFGQIIPCLSTSNPEDAGTSVRIRERNVDTLLESTSNSIIEFPWDIGGSQDQDTIHIISYTLHLNEEFGFNSARGIVFSLRSATTQRIDLIDENDRGLLVTGHLKQLFDQLFRFSHPLAHQVRR